MTKLIIALHSFANAPRSNEAILTGFSSVVQVFYLFEAATLFTNLIKSILDALFIWLFLALVNVNFDPFTL
jgi:hypothetical protein